jgi:hypothetical protein
MKLLAGCFIQIWSFEEKKILAPEDDVEFILSNPLEEVSTRALSWH